MLRDKQVKSVLNKHRKRDSWFLDDYSVNPYEGRDGAISKAVKFLKFEIIYGTNQPAGANAHVLCG